MISIEKKAFGQRSDFPPDTADFFPGSRVGGSNRIIARFFSDRNQNQHGEDCGTNKYKGQHNCWSFKGVES